MDLTQAFCGGLDVQKMSVIACARCIGSQGQVEREGKTSGTTTKDLLALFDWLFSKRDYPFSNRIDWCLLEPRLTHSGGWRRRTFCLTG